LQTFQGFLVFKNNPGAFLNTRGRFKTSLNSRPAYEPHKKHVVIVRSEATENLHLMSWSSSKSVTSSPQSLLICDLDFTTAYFWLYCSLALVTVKGKVHLHRAAFAFSGTVITDRAGILPRPQQARPTLTDFELCSHTAAIKGHHL